MALRGGSVTSKDQNGGGSATPRPVAHGGGSATLKG
jgi:hypothetical protein